MSLTYRVGDVFDRLAEIPDGSIDLIVTSPPFLALRSYLPSDHPDKAKEIGSEPTPAEFIDTLLALSAEWGRVLAPHGSICVELGDTYSGANTGGERTDGGQYGNWQPADAKYNVDYRPAKGSSGWPLAKSLTGIPTLYPWSLAYGRNILTGEPSPAGQWRIRNLIVWARPNPPVGALGDKFRPATSYITVACKGAKRYFDLDAVRTEAQDMRPRSTNGSKERDSSESLAGTGYDQRIGSNPAGAPPLDWHTDNHPEDGDWLWKLSTQPYKGSHYATYPLTLPKRLIEAMCPLKVCRTCGVPSTRIVGDAEYVNDDGTTREELDERWRHGRVGLAGDQLGKAGHLTRQAPTLGWTDCGCSCDTCDGKTKVKLPDGPYWVPCPNCDGTGEHQWRTGIVLDPFAGSGTTLEAAQAVGRHAIGIDLDDRNADLAQSRVGMFLDIDRGAA